MYCALQDGLSSELELQVDFVVNLVTNLSALLESGASPPSEYIYIVNSTDDFLYVTDRQCTYRNVICASNFACVLSNNA